MKTTLARNETVKRDWYIVDAADKILGRLASPLAMILMGKHKPIYTPHVDTGDFVIVVNADKVKVTGKKFNQKTYKHYTGYGGGLKEVPMTKMMAKRPEEIIFQAVKRMVPSTKLGKSMIMKLKVFKGPKHNHQAQMPKPIEECAWWKGMQTLKTAKHKTTQIG
ncbi:MAG: 50S ribosomal protein L13 [Planctomycetes bacterium]|nr:50S ribosomal protein L13 [Planctomycetota bacterium]